MRVSCFGEAPFTVESLKGSSGRNLSTVMSSNFSLLAPVSRQISNVVRNFSCERRMYHNIFMNNKGFLDMWY